MMTYMVILPLMWIIFMTVIHLAFHWQILRLSSVPMKPCLMMTASVISAGITGFIKSHLPMTILTMYRPVMARKRQEI